MTIDEIIADIRSQLDWRGPGGQPQGHVVMPRKDADDLLVTLELLLQAHRAKIAEGTSK